MRLFQIETSVTQSFFKEIIIFYLINLRIDDALPFSEISGRVYNGNMIFLTFLIENEETHLTHSFLKMIFSICYLYDFVVSIFGLLTINVLLHISMKNIFQRLRNVNFQYL